MQLYNENFFKASSASLWNVATPVHRAIQVCNMGKSQAKVYFFDYWEQKEWLVLPSFLPSLGVEREELGTSQKQQINLNFSPPPCGKTIRILFFKIYHVGLKRTGTVQYPYILMAPQNIYFLL